MTWFVPGRIEVLGKHTDYAGGRSLLVASEQGVVANVTPLDQAGALPLPDAGTFRARSAAAPDTVQIVAGELPRLLDDSPLPGGHWGNYVQTVVDRLTLNFGPLQSAAIEVQSTLPLASGMSSSSALIVAIALALADQNDLWNRPEWQQNIESQLDLASFAASIENGADFGTLKGTKGVGTKGASQDHTGMLCSHEGQLTSFGFSPLRELGSAPMPDGYTFAVAVSGVLAEKTGAALKSYNDAADRVATLVRVWNQGGQGAACTTLAQVLESTPTAAEDLAQMLRSDPELAAQPDLMERLLAFLVEVGEAIPVAEAALRAGDLQAFGDAVNLSHRNADQNLHNQVPETNALQRLALELGAPAASAFGAGFGGSVWALVQTDQADDFADAWLSRYLELFPEHRDRASVLLTGAGAAAHRLSVGD